MISLHWLGWGWGQGSEAWQAFGPWLLWRGLASASESEQYSMSTAGPCLRRGYRAGRSSTPVWAATWSKGEEKYGANTARICLQMISSHQSIFKLDIKVWWGRWCISLPEHFLPIHCKVKKIPLSLIELRVSMGAGARKSWRDLAEISGKIQRVKLCWGPMRKHWET